MDWAGALQSWVVPRLEIIGFLVSSMVFWFFLVLLVSSMVSWCFCTFYWFLEGFFGIHVDWLGGWLAGWLASWLAGCLAGLLVGWLTAWLLGRLADWLADLPGELRRSLAWKLMETTSRMSFLRFLVKI